MLPPYTAGSPTVASSRCTRLDVVDLPLLPVTPTETDACSAIHSAVPLVTVIPAASRSATSGWYRLIPGERSTTSTPESAAAAPSPATSGTGPTAACHSATDRPGLSSTPTTRTPGRSRRASAAATPSRPVPHSATRRPARSDSRGSADRAGPTGSAGPTASAGEGIEDPVPADRDQAPALRVEHLRALGVGGPAALGHRGGQACQYRVGGALLA